MSLWAGIVAHRGEIVGLFALLLPMGVLASYYIRQGILRRAAAAIEAPLEP